ncbi:DUF420 domain-containing protein [Paenibacillus tarimensis]|uniref:DUF420 domain-containing protein n=1 Tax=Paenibacillus tarimensis TaxID=416012 RepID=UPI0038B29D09
MILDKQKERNWVLTIFGFSIILVGIITVLFFLPGYEGEVGFDVTILPLLNAIYNCFTFTFLIIALAAIKRRNIAVHRTFILAAFTTTALFLICYVIYHFLTEPTKFGGSEVMRYVYFFILVTHILLAIINVPLALLSIVWGYTNNISKHRKISRWTMPVWLYVSCTGVIVYLLISPYY